QALGSQQDIRFHAEIVRGPHLARTSDAGLDLVENQENAVIVADFAPGPEELGARHHVTPLALERLDEHSRDLFRGYSALEKTFRRCSPVDASVGIVVRQVR